MDSVDVRGSMYNLVVSYFCPVFIHFTKFPSSAQIEQYPCVNIEEDGILLKGGETP